jgi:nucleotide-binding universal stress UspA family protein
MAGIIFATHGGATAEGAGRVAVLLADRLGMRLHVLGISEPLPIVDSGYGVAYVPSPQECDDVYDALRASVAEQLHRVGALVSPEILVGPAASEIVTVARREAADIIVVGLGPHHLIDRALGHETALELVQLASTPVLAVPETMTSLPRRIIVAVDFSPTSVASARSCARWLVKGDLLHLVHVASERNEGGYSAMRTTAARELEALALQLGAGEGVRVEETVVQGEPAEQLLHLAASTNADLIALGSHGYGIWKRLTIGSVASKVIRLSPRAVLVTSIHCLAAIGVDQECRKEEGSPA